MKFKERFAAFLRRVADKAAPRRHDVNISLAVKTTVYALDRATAVALAPQLPGTEPWQPADFPIYLKKHLAELLGYALLEQGKITFSTQPDETGEQRAKYIATVDVARPETPAPALVENL